MNRKISENTKITLTVKQLKRLVRESNNDYESQFLEEPTDDERGAMDVINTTKFPTKAQYAKMYKKEHRLHHYRDDSNPIDGIYAWMTATHNAGLDKEAERAYELAKSGWEKQQEIDKAFDTPITVNGTKYNNRGELKKYIRRRLSRAEVWGEMTDELQKWADTMFEIATRAKPNADIEFE